MNDKILFIDFMNAVYRASISFPGKKTKTHVPCAGGFDEVCDHSHADTHCACGALWDMIEDKCLAQPDDTFVFVYNFFRNLRPIIEMFSPDKVFIVREGHPQFRFELYPEYKANRLIKRASTNEEKAEKFTRSKEIILQLLQHLPITVAMAIAYEADDTIATLCNNLSEEELIILSGDTDYIQLLQRGYKNIKIYDPIKKTYMEAPEYPYLPWKSLRGDKSDNIKGLMSDKKAIKLLSNPEEFKKFLSIEENRANFNVNKQLIEFANVPLEQIEFQEGKKDFDSLKQEFTKMEFKSLLDNETWTKFTKTFDCIQY